MHESPSWRQHFDTLQEVKAALLFDQQTVAGNAASSASLDTLADELNRLGDDQALRVALIGTCNAGKSSISNELIGKPNALPVKHVSSTGNMTIVRVLQGINSTETVLEEFSLHFFSRIEAEECLQFLLGELLPLLNRPSSSHESPRIPDILQTECRQLAMQQASHTIWSESVDWIKRVRPYIQNLVGLRLDELVRFISTWQSHGAKLAGKKMVVPADVAYAAMWLDDNFNKQSSQSQVDPNHFDIDTVAEVRQIVRAVRLTARVPKSVWDLSQLQVPAIELIDFPGLGADSSSGRDRFLMVLEQRNPSIHTWASVAPANDPRGFDTTSFLGNYDSRRLVYVLNKFDTIPMPAEKNWFDTAANQTGPLSVNELVQNLSSLNKWHSDLRLTAMDHCAFVSAEHSVAARETALKWRKIVARLDPNDCPELRSLLSNYASDNEQLGLKSLRHLLVHHANVNGQWQIAAEYERMLAIAEKKVSQWLKQHEETSRYNFSQVRSLQRKLQSLNSHLVHMRWPVSINEVPVSEVSLARDYLEEIDPGTEADSLGQFVRALALNEIWNWNEWNSLLQCASPQDGFLSVRAASGALPDTQAHWKRFLPQQSLDLKIPTKATDLVGSFESAFRRVEKVAMDVLRDSLALMVRRLVSDLRRNYQVEARQVAHQDSFLACVFAESASNSPDENELMQMMLHHWPYHECDISSSRIQSYFPFRLPGPEADPQSPGTYFGWAPERQNQGVRERPQHQIYVLRLRQELTASLERGVVERLSALLAEFKSQWNMALSILLGDIKTFSSMSTRSLAEHCDWFDATAPTQPLKLAALLPQLRAS